MAAFAPPEIGKMVKEATIPQKTNETLDYIRRAHAILDRIDGNANALAHPQEQPESLVQSTQLLTTEAATLVSRLETLFG